MKIISYNVNGIRAALRKGFAEWLAANDFDIVCVQETKAHPEQVDRQVFTDLGYTDHWHSATRRKGYSGLLTLSRLPVDHVVEGCGMEVYDCEGRILRTDFGDTTLLNCYFPSGTTGDERQAFKMEFLRDFQTYIDTLRQERPTLIVVGDYNIAHTELDIHNPKSNQKTSGFLPEERAWLSNWYAHGFVDSFRHLHPDLQEYSWWSTRFNSRANNKGWRIDYQSVTTDLQDRLIHARQLTDVVHSDHCPVLIELQD